MTGLVAGIGGKIAASLIFGRVKAVAVKGVGILTSIPEPVWEAIAVVGYVVAMFALHQHYANAAIKAADAAGYERRASEDAAALIELHNRARTAEVNLAQISQEERTKNAEADRAVAALGSSLLAKGPGAASGRQLGHPGVPSAPGGPQQAAQPPGAAAAGVPSEDGSDPLAAVSWRWLVGTGEQCDIERAENVSWRTAYQRWAAEWAKLKGGK